MAQHTLPPPREGKEDIPLLADHFREVFNREFRKEIGSISPEALEVLQDWDWPGNVRELRNVIERALIFADGKVLHRAELPELGTIQIDPTRPDSVNGLDVPKDLTLADAENEYILHTLEEGGGSIQRAAENLGISRKNLWEKRQKDGLLD